MYQRCADATPRRTEQGLQRLAPASAYRFLDLWLRLRLLGVVTAEETPAPAARGGRAGLFGRLVGLGLGLASEQGIAVALEHVVGDRTVILQGDTLGPGPVPHVRYGHYRPLTDTVRTRRRQCSHTISGGTDDRSA
jgi:hypothetical protein